MTLAANFFLPLRRVWFATLGALLLFASIPLQAAESVEWLLIADTSFSMRRKHDTTVKIIRELFLDEFNSLIYEGEKVNFWIFRDELFADQFPPLLWNSGQKEQLAEKAAGFLSSQKYAKRGQLPPVISAVQNEAFKHKTLVVFLLTDGEDDIRGTPFDGTLNGDFLLYRSNLRRANLPFVTMLVYQRGLCVAARVHPGAGKITLPIARAARPQVAEPEIAPMVETSNGKVQEAASNTNILEVQDRRLEDADTNQLSNPIEAAQIPAVASGSVVPVNQTNPENREPQTKVLEMALVERPEGSPARPEQVPLSTEGQLIMSKPPGGAPAPGHPAKGVGVFNKDDRNEQTTGAPKPRPVIQDGALTLQLWLGVAGLAAITGIWLLLRRRKPSISLISESFSKK